MPPTVSHPLRTALGAAVLALALAGAGGAAPDENGPATPAATPEAPVAHNVVIFVADGLRHDSVDAQSAPALTYVREHGVHFVNSHSLFPTLTTANASAIATGHYLGDTGDYSNSIYTAFPIFADGNFGQPAGSYTPFLENDAVLGDLDMHYANGNYLDEESLLALARRHGFGTAAIGKLGPVGIQDVTQLNPVGGQFTVPQTIVIDDATGSAAGVPLSAAMRAALAAAGLPAATPKRRQPAGDLTHPGTLDANQAQQQFFIDAATRAVLPLLRGTGHPFVLVYWSRDPDGTQHNQGDSLNALTPGINGPTSRRAVADADSNLQRLLEAISADPQLAATTDVFVTSDHGFATISKHELDAGGHTSHAFATRFSYHNAGGVQEVRRGWLPPGFLAIDLAHALGLPLYDPDTRLAGPGAARFAAVDPRIARPDGTRLQHPQSGNGLIGGSGRASGASDARVIVAANGGSDLIYVPGNDRALARRIVRFLGRQDYIGGLFADEALGGLPGTLPLAAIGFHGAAQPPRPTLIVTFKTFAADPRQPLLSAAQISDVTLQEGQGMHGSLGRDNTYNNMAAIGPDFKAGYVDALPVGNADIAPTLAHVLGLELPAVGKLTGRVLYEALPGGVAQVAAHSRVTVSKPGVTGRVTVLEFQQAGEQRYFDRACFLPITEVRRLGEGLCAQVIAAGR